MTAQVKEKIDLSPYPGLRPFRESDGRFFFGRERDIRVIASNLISSSLTLTVLYGPSGVGKSSVLQAGVIAQVRKTPMSGIVYFNEWQDASFLNVLNQRCREAILGPSTGSLEEVLRRPEGPVLSAARSIQKSILQYHIGSKVQDEFEGLLARLVNRADGSHEGADRYSCARTHHCSGWMSVSVCAYPIFWRTLCNSGI